MSNLPALLPKATPLVSGFFASMLKKRQRSAIVNLANNFSISAKFTDVYCNCNRQFSCNIIDVINLINLINIQGVIESCTYIYFNHELLAPCRTRKKYLKNSMSKNKMTFIF
jgi:hypothetical protein